MTPLILITLFFRFNGEWFLFAKYSVLFLFLIPIFFIDLYHRLILDIMTIPMMIIGLSIAFVPNMDISILNAFLTSALILFLLLLISWIFEKIRHKEGMGGGDIKLLAAMSTFLGVMNISFILLISSILALIVALISRKTRESGIPYAPFLVVSTLLLVLFGSSFLTWYMGII
ncbi:MAG: prepilin peptidase [Candidatus Cloacimonetes bacterium]|nr:prepilin peptidase [Candidatus Cloacimonadota bacterium]